MISAYMYMHYLYTSDLLELDQCRPQSGKWTVQERLLGVFTPLHVDRWESSLTQHLDRDYVDYILTGIKEGFRVGFYDVAPLSSARRNMHALSNREFAGCV